MAGWYLKINIGSINIGSMANASSFNIGRNYLSEFESMTKTNKGLGNIFGNDTELPSSINCVEDPDGLDMWRGTNDSDKEEKLIEKLKETL